MVEMQEILDEQMREEAAARGEGGEPPPPPGLSYKYNCSKQIELAVEDRFHDLLNKVRKGLKKEAEIDRSRQKWAEVGRIWQEWQKW